MKDLAIRVLVAALVVVFDHAASSQTKPAWVNVTGNLAYQPSACGNLALLSAMPGSTAVIAGVVMRGLWMNPGDSKWAALGTDAGSQRIWNGTTSIQYDPENTDVFWESGIYHGPGVYRTNDKGRTFKQLGAVAHNDYVSIDFTDAKRRTLLAGGHESPQTVHLSTDGGETWTNIGQNLPPTSGASTNPLVIDATTYVVNAFGSGSSGGIYRTVDSGASWLRVASQGPAGAPLVAKSGVIYWAYRNSIVLSTNRGRSWSQAGAGLREIAPVEIPDGRIVSVSTENSLVLSGDGGETWTPIGPPLPYTPLGLIYSAGRGAFLIWRSDCGDIVQPNAIMSLDMTFAAPATPPKRLIPPAPSLKH